eukprot:TRINITY_DN1937_c0_g1_i1.p1 TRINITY_DN1937_c0_g1~~TRINITY_DN1937_c0_g1_i1.p1  ORF type:complete len:537 (+),score=119.63 TRINITY_DN1937_c0_g1_i1:69-1613(+)
MKTLRALATMAAMVSSANGVINSFTLANVKTCSANDDCGIYVDPVSTNNVCTTTTNFCTTCNSGNLDANFKQCFPADATTADAVQVKVLYTFEHTGTVDCTKYTLFREEFRTQVVNQLNGKATVREIVHLCATGTNTLRTSVRLQLQKANLGLTEILDFGKNLDTNVLTATAPVPLSYMGTLLSASMIGEQYKPCTAASNAAYTAEFPSGNCYPIECSAGYTLKIAEANPRCLPSTAADASSVRVCSDNSNCMQFGDNRATCNVASARCSCSNGNAHYTAIPSGTNDMSTYYNCFPAADLPLVAMSKNIDLMFNIHYDKADCTKSSILANEYATLINTILLGTQVVVKSIHHYCPEEGTLGLFTVIRVTAQINDLYSDAVLDFPAKTIAGIQANNHNLHYVGTSHSYFQIANIEQASTQCLTPVGSVLNAYFGFDHPCVSVTCGPDFEVNERGVCVSTTPPPVPESDDELSAGAVAGIIVGAVAGVVIIAVIIYCVCSQGGEQKEAEEVVAAEE